MFSKSLKLFSIFLLSIFFEFINGGLLAQSKSSSVTITINNPNFRKLVIASPDFEGDAKKDIQLVNFMKQSKDEFPSLLKFTGFFKLLDSKAFGEKKESQLNVDELAMWKMLSVDTVVKGKFIKSGKVIKLEMSGLDVYRDRDFDKKVYTISSGTELNKSMKKYIDYLLETYTGKPGIYQSKLVFAGKQQKNSPREIYTCDPDGTNLERITNDNVIHISPSWHPSGKKIVYTSYEKGTPNLYVYNLVSKTKTPVFEEEKNKTKASVPRLTTAKGIMNSGGKYSPHGKLLVYTQIQEGTNLRQGSADIYLTSEPGEVGALSHLRPFIKGDGIDVDPVFSPDGKWLVYVSGRYGNPHLFKAELLWNNDFTDVKVKSEQRLTFAGWWNAMPSWSPDSQKIVFAGFDKDINRFDIFMMNNDGNKLERLTLQSGDNKSPSFSPNGQLIVFHSSRIGTASDRGRNQLYIMNQDGTEQRVISTGLYDAEDPKWGPYMGSN